MVVNFILICSVQDKYRSKCRYLSKISRTTSIENETKDLKSELKLDDSST